MPVNYLDTIFEIVERSIFEAIREDIVRRGYLPDIADTARYTDDPAGVQNWADDLAVIRASMGFVVEVFGASSSRDKYEKKLPRIIVIPKRVYPGDLGGDSNGYYITVADKLYATARPPLVTNYQFEVGLAARNIQQLRVLMSCISVVFSRRTYIKLYNNPDVEFFVKQTMYRDYPDVDYGVMEYFYGFEACDIWDKIEVATNPTSPLTDIHIDVEDLGGEDLDDITIP